MSKKLLLILSFILSSLIISCNTDDKTGAGDDKTGVVANPPAKEEISKYKGPWSGSINKVSGDTSLSESLTVVITINDDGSITDSFNDQTIALNKINKESNNVFSFTSENDIGGEKRTHEYKIDFSNANSPQATVVDILTKNGTTSKATYSGNLKMDNKN